MMAKRKKKSLQKHLRKKKKQKGGVLNGVRVDHHASKDDGLLDLGQSALLESMDAPALHRESLGQKDPV
jgi:hypothetical protein